jgi:HPt (histidine-containing phosphotransfer) domain-containing protein
MEDPADTGESGDSRGRGKATTTFPPAVLDTQHLERQVFGDRKLRQELLQLYAGRLQALAPAICAAPGPDRREAAHSLKGASLAVGAFALAQLCDSLETHELEDRRHEAALMIETTRLRVEELLRAGD